MRKYYIFIGLLCLFCIGLVVAVITLTGTPARQKAVQTDQKRISDFGMISMSTNSYYLAHNRLPASLQELKGTDGYLTITDPETNTNYSYKTTSGDTYELCTTFMADSKDDTSSSQYSSTYSLGTSRQHKRGYDCLSYTVPASYKPATKPAPSTNAKTTKPTTIVN